jgi:phage N-6-adenine-methyltransferase
MKNMTEILPPLDVVAKEIRTLHKANEAILADSSTRGLENAIRVGELLAGVKSTLKHGEWLPWLKGNVEFNKDTAARYMRCWDRRSDFKCVSVTHLSMAYRLLADTMDGGDGTHNHRAQGTGENEWFTPEEHIMAARACLEAIDVDPASHAKAQEFIKAKKFFTKKDDGLTKSWVGRVWLNPPYTQPDIELFTDKLISEVGNGNTAEAIMLTHNYTDTAWFHKAANASERICFTRGRIAFVGMDGVKAVPTQGQAFFYFGKRAARFGEYFRKFGFIT